MRHVSALRDVEEEGTLTLGRLPALGFAHDIECCAIQPIEESA